MDLLDKKSDLELLQSLLAEMAKANNEIKCAQADLNKAQSRMKFLLLLANTMIDRQKD
jgi:hypothetical protein